MHMIPIDRPSMDRHLIGSGNLFRPHDRQHFAEQTVNLPVATSDSGKLTSAALRALDKIYRPGHHYKKAGVMLLFLPARVTRQAGMSFFR
jgi:DNA polymerase V